MQPKLRTYVNKKKSCYQNSHVNAQAVKSAGDLQPKLRTYESKKKLCNQKKDNSIKNSLNSILKSVSCKNAVTVMNQNDPITQTIRLKTRNVTFNDRGIVLDKAFPRTKA